MRPLIATLRHDTRINMGMAVIKIVSIFNLFVAMSVIAFPVAHAAYFINSVLYSDVCRANANPNYFFVYPLKDAEPVGASCTLPDGTPGTVTAN
jgi:hypothetical protein